MATATTTPLLLLRTNPNRLPPSGRHARTKPPRLFLTSPLRQSRGFPPILRTKFNTKRLISCAYVTGPASDPIVSEPDLKLHESDSRTEEIQSPPNLITWGLLWSLLMKHKLRLGLSVLTLVGCTTCTLSMPIFSGTTGRFF